jgi:ParB family chromosome partitioning protein
MGKSFAPRIKKSERETLDFSEKLNRDLFKMSDDLLLRDAKLDEIELAKIKVKDQVRTKFNDHSIKDLGENIRLNGLIQPLVLHKKNGELFLLCGERRFRAMNFIEKKTAPCFILENKTPEELMAIQFSENSSREELHYIDKAEGIYNYQKATNASERQIMKVLGISKSEVHRSLLVAKVPHEVKQAAKTYDIEKYVLLEWNEIVDQTLRAKILNEIIIGKVTKRSHLKKLTADAAKLKPLKQVANAAEFKKLSAKKVDSQAALIKVLEQTGSEIVFDEKTKALLAKMIESSP